jgi:purine-binding chemotaxis protein CheW
VNLAVSDSAFTAPLQGARGERTSEIARQYLTFSLNTRSYAIPLAEVAEITNNLELNHMPHMPKGVEGLLNLRGNVLPVINLRTRMGLPPIETKSFENVLILDMDGHRTGVLVDRVESVITATQDLLIPASPLLAGPDGGWSSGFVLQQQRVVVILDARRLTALGSARIQTATAGKHDLARSMDDDLKKLIEMAPPRVEAESGRLIPQMEAAINHTEEEMAKVVDRIETMLTGADKAFQGLARLKQEAKLGRLPGQEAAIAEIERIGTEIQEQVFELLHQIQFQDIARQKLERVLSHIRGLQLIVGQKFRDLGKA